MTAMAHSIYTILLALWVGGISIFTFVVTPDIFRSYNKDAAGEIVGKLFPHYFMFTLLASILALVILPLCKSIFSHSELRWSFALVIVAVLINVFIIFKLHPDIRKVKEEIHSFESLSEDAPLRKQFRKLHGASMALNLLLLADGVTLLLISTSVKR